MIAPVLVMLTTMAMQAAPPPLVPNSANATASRLHIGATGIHCVRLPCPSRAVFEPDAQTGQPTRNGMPYVDLDGSMPAPPMIGEEADLLAIRESWGKRQCLAVDGRLIPGEDDWPVLRVDRIVGPCGGQ